MLGGGTAAAEVAVVEQIGVLDNGSLRKCSPAASLSCITIKVSPNGETRCPDSPLLVYGCVAMQL